MSFFGSLFGKKEHEAIALIDIGSASVAGAYAEFALNNTPTIHYSVRIPIEHGEHDSVATSLERALLILGERMVKEGAPALLRALGNAHVHTVMATIAAPWQETLVSVKTIEPGHPFTFTHSMMKEVVSECAHPAKGRRSTEISVIATLLDGYETRAPFGKNTNRADMIALSSTIDEEIADVVTRALRRTFHTHSIEIKAFLPACYTVLRDVYPHESDFLVLDVSGSATDLALIKHGYIVGARSFAQGTRNLLSAAHTAGIHATTSVNALTSVQEGVTTLINSDHNHHLNTEIENVRSEWIGELTHNLEKFSEHHALARTVFVFADEELRDFYAKVLDDATLRKLWLSDDALRIVSVAPTHFAHFVRTQGDAEGDIFLDILVLFYAKSLHAP